MKGLPELKTSIARQLDAKFDDGYPLSGSILILAGSDGAGGGAYDVVDDASYYYPYGNTCMNRGTTPYTYAVADQQGCTLSWRASF